MLVRSLIASPWSRALYPDSAPATERSDSTDATDFTDVAEGRQDGETAMRGIM